MKYSINSRLTQSLPLADELRVSRKDFEAIPDLPKGKRLLLENSDYDIEKLKLYKRMGFSICVVAENIPKSLLYRANEIPFVLNSYITSLYDLEAMIDLGASQAYIGAPLFFELTQIPTEWLEKIELRAVANAANPTQLPHKNGAIGTWIRPEDVSIYEPYISTLEFAAKDGAQEEELLRIYRVKRKWDLDLSLVVQDLGYEATNRLILPTIGQKRLSCGQRCLRSNSGCQLCETVLQLAQVNFAQNAQAQNHKVLRDKPEYIIREED